MTGLERCQGSVAPTRAVTGPVAGPVAASRRVNTRLCCGEYAGTAQPHAVPGARCPVPVLVQRLRGQPRAASVPHMMIRHCTGAV